MNRRSRPEGHTKTAPETGLLAERLRIVPILVAIVAALCAAALWLRPDQLRPRQPTPAYLVGAFYQLTMPEGLLQHSLRRELVPPQTPQLGLYESSNLRAVERHIEWASQYGVDFFALEYWPNRPSEDVRPEIFLEAENLDDVHFCLNLQMKSFGYNEDRQEIVLDQETLERLDEDLETIAETFLEHPRYLKVKDRPVLMLQDSHRLRGSRQVAIALIKERLTRNGVEPFLVGDELGAETPDPERLKLFDAISDFQPFQPERETLGGYAAHSQFIERTRERHQLFAGAVGPELPVVPTLLPGYNDRALTGSHKRAILPRLFQGRDDETGSLLSEMFDQYVVGAVAPDVPLILVNSFNDWTRDTALEPLGTSEPTIKDTSGKHLLTGGFPYRGFGNDYLELLRAKTCAISGILHDKDWYPSPRSLIGVWQDGELKAATRTDSLGRFNVSRRNLEPGEYWVGASWSDATLVQVEPGVVPHLYLRNGPATSEQPLGPTERLRPLFPIFHSELKSLLERFNASDYTQVEASGLRLILEPGSQPGQPALEEVMERLLEPGQTVLAIGASPGYHTLKAAESVGHGGRVIATATRAEDYLVLLHNLKQNNNPAQVTPLWMAMGERVGLWKQPGQRAVEKRTVDSLGLSEVSLILVHSQGEGTEPPLLGARRLIEASQPAILQEIPKPALVPYALGVLAAMNYRAEKIEGTDYYLARPMGEGPDRHLLDIGSPDSERFVADGLSGSERPDRHLSYCWSDDDESLLYLHLRQAHKGSYALGVSARAFYPISPVRVEVLFNGAPVGVLTFTRPWTASELEVPYSLVKQGYNAVLLRYAKTGRPSGLTPGSEDTRNLAISLDKVWLAPKELEAATNP